jgi:hypothetical protein
MRTMSGSVGRRTAAAVVVVVVAAAVVVVVVVVAAAAAAAVVVVAMAVGTGGGVGTVLHDVALEDFEDTFPAGHERQLVCPLAGWYLPLGQYV